MSHAQGGNSTGFILMYEPVERYMGNCKLSAISAHRPAGCLITVDILCQLLDTGHLENALQLE